MWSNPGCLGEELPTSEVCNGLDDDCDGPVDNAPAGGELPGVGVDCVTPGGCPGLTICDAGSHTIECQSQSGDLEICNGLDDDCDTLVDELPAPGEPDLCDAAGKCAGGECTPPGVERVCTPGHYECVAGAMECVGAVLPEDEVCDGQDNDCDGQIDEGDLCEPGSLCYEGECVIPCKDDEFPCPGGQVCIAAPDLDARALCADLSKDECYCLASLCLGQTCQTGWLCSERDGQCFDPCVGVTCPGDQRCLVGRCVDCTVLPCPDGEVCSAGTCIENACAAKECPAGTYCSGGVCYEDCDLLDCPEGTVCRTGACVTDYCAGVVCELGLCNPATGECDHFCGTISCSIGTICAPTERACVPDPCLTTVCPSCQECRVEPFSVTGTCDWSAVCQEQALYARGSACAVGAAGASPAPLLLLLLLAPARWRRRRGGR